MFPIINSSSFFKTESSAQNYFNKSPKDLKSSGVFSQVCLRQNSCSEEFNSSDVLSANICADKVYIIYENKIIGLCSGKWDWIRSVRIANDIQSFNVIVEKVDTLKMQIRTVRNIEMNEEVIAWFSEDVLYEMGITHLSPVNIQGQNRYVCHKCEKQFEYPNPLKIHIAADCELCMEKSINVLWNRLSVGLKHSTISLRQSSSPESISSTHNMEIFPRRPSAFQPIPRNTNLLDPIKAASNFETFVSNMGSSKRGNLCLYCGKLYSRKYGLKIHIRTHTGYKPLKCKYCDRSFGDPSNLNKHTRLHRESRAQNYVCRVCNKNLIRKRDLERHLQTHHGV